MAERRRVLLAIGSMEAGGAERQVVEILKALDRRRFEPHLYLTYRRGRLLAEVPDDVSVHAFSDRHLPPRINWPGRIHRQQVRDLARVLNQQQIDVLYARTFHTNLAASPAAQQASVPHILVEDSNPPADMPATAGRFVGFKRRLLRRAYLNADRAVAVSEGVRQSMIEYYGLPAPQVEVCLNFVDLQRIDRLVGHAQRASRDDRFGVFSAGRLTKSKGIHFLIDAIRMLVKERGRRDVHLTIAGAGPYKHLLKTMVDEFGLGDYVAFVGWLDNPLASMAVADLFCLPSLYEGLPTVLLEAMAARVPVVAAACPSGPREILANGAFGRLVPPASSLALADAIDDAISNYPAWQSRVAAARAHVEEHYSKPVGMARIEALILSVAANP